MRRSSWAACGVILACLTLTACNDRNTDPAGYPPPPTTPPAPTDGDAGVIGTTITIQNFAFSPANLIVPAGATITVINMDPVPHTVTSQTLPDTFIPGPVGTIVFDTGPFMGQTTFTIPADAVSGTFVPYFCAIHTSMMLNRANLTIQ
ncbi:hypothetical protein JGU66_29250 [Myxococcaceae bacterium JPH2]|nr:hypothetical protein [Myxococcaceae bacterium JPH2]